MQANCWERSRCTSHRWTDSWFRQPPYPLHLARSAAQAPQENASTSNEDGKPGTGRLANGDITCEHPSSSSNSLLDARARNTLTQYAQSILCRSRSLARRSEHGAAVLEHVSATHECQLRGCAAAAVAQYSSQWIWRITHEAICHFERNKRMYNFQRSSQFGISPIGAVFFELLTSLRHACSTLF